MALSCSSRLVFTRSRFESSSQAIGGRKNRMEHLSANARPLELLGLAWLATGEIRKDNLPEAKAIMGLPKQDRASVCCGFL